MVYAGWVVRDQTWRSGHAPLRVPVPASHTVAVPFEPGVPADVVVVPLNLAIPFEAAPHMPLLLAQRQQEQKLAVSPERGEALCAREGPRICD